MDIKKIQSKLQKLLALSASPNEAEASSAMRKCKELMEKWGIRTIDVDEDTNEVGISTAVVPGQTLRHRSWESSLAGNIAQCFDAECVIQRRQSGWNVMFISTVSEQEIIVDLYKRLRRIISNMSKEYARTHEGNSAKLQKSYAFGMIATVSDRLSTVYKETPSTTALVVVKEEAIADKVHGLFGKVKRHKTSLPKDALAYSKGEEDGVRVPLNKSLHSGTTQATIN